MAMSATLAPTNGLGGGPNQNFTLVIGDVPEPSTWVMMLLGFAGLGVAGYRAARTTGARA